MNAVQFAPSLDVTAGSSRFDHHGEAVLATPRHSSMLDDRVFASHAVFSSRVATIVLARPGGGGLRYTSRKAIASFDAADLPSRLGPGDRITRGWDGLVFEITSATREGPALCCELREIPGRVH